MRVSQPSHRRGLRRIVAILIAALAIAVLASVPFLAAEHLRESAKNSLGGVANGNVIAVESDGQAFTMVVEYQIPSGSARYRFRAPVETVGLLRARPRLQQGDPVLVAYDPSNPSAAHVFGIRTLWNALVRRVLISLLLMIAAVAIFVSAGKRTPTVVPDLPA